MTPRFIAQDTGYSSTGNANLIGYFLLGKSSFAQVEDCQNKCIGQHGRVMIDPFAYMAFVFGVGYVIGLCAQKQVAGIHAGRIVIPSWAIMTNEQTVLDRAVVQFPTKAVSQHIKRSFPADNDTVATATSSSPQPTGVRFVDALPKSICKACNALLLVIARFTAKLCLSLSQPVTLCGEVVTALQAGATNTTAAIDNYGWFIVQAVNVFRHVLSPIVNALSGSGLVCDHKPAQQGVVNNCNAIWLWSQVKYTTGVCI